MTRQLFIFLVCILMTCSSVLAQPTTAWQTSTDDLTHFWQAYDSIGSTRDSATQRGYIRTLYIDRASEGLKAFMRNKEGLDERWVASINNERAFWERFRPKMALIKQMLPLLEANLARYQQLYPLLKPAELFFLVGIRQQGGTIRNNRVLIGTEVALADTTATVDQLLLVCLHEYTHTQQVRPDFQQINVLTSSIREGACDFIAELVSGKSLVAPYRTYGLAHEKAVWASFEREMYTHQNDRWVSTGPNPELPAPDLGYFVGYQICASYYRQASDKREAIQEIMQLDYADTRAVTRFLETSKYNPTSSIGAGSK